MVATSTPFKRCKNIAPAFRTTCRQNPCQKPSSRDMHNSKGPDKNGTQTGKTGMKAHDMRISTAVLLRTSAPHCTKSCHWLVDGVHSLENTHLANAVF